MDLELIGPIAGRLGRYPQGELGTCSWSGLIADTNFPVEGSEWWKFMEAAREGWEIFKQPGGLSDAAENLQWLGQTAESLKLAEDDPIRLELGRAWYRRALSTGSKAWGKRYIHAEYGADPSGTAVFANSFKRGFHVRQGLRPEGAGMLLVGQDFGRNPWSIICQPLPSGRLRVLEEVPGVDIGLEQHLIEHLKPALMKPQYLGRPLLVIGDPAGKARSSLFEMNEFDLLARHHLAALPAPTNDPDRRIRSVERLLLQAPRGEPMIEFDEENCPQLVFGLNGGYRFAKTKDGETKPKPDKNDFSHVNDGLQYVTLVFSEPAAFAWAARQVYGRPHTQKPPPSARGWT
jgi:hypothetical protein